MGKEKALFLFPYTFNSHILDPYNKRENWGPELKELVKVFQPVHVGYLFRYLQDLKTSAVPLHHNQFIKQKTGTLRCKLLARGRWPESYTWPWKEMWHPELPGKSLIVNYPNEAVEALTLTKSLSGRLLDKRQGHTFASVNHLDWNALQKLSALETLEVI